jgi:hypothetical protein
VVRVILVENGHKWACINQDGDVFSHPWHE